MNTAAADPRRARIAKIVSGVLKRRIPRQLDEIDSEFLDLAAEALTAILLLDARMKHGPLSPEQAAIYAVACRNRDTALAMLNTKNPYRPKAN